MGFVVIILIVALLIILFLSRGLMFNRGKKAIGTLTGKNVERLVSEHIDIQGTILIGMHKEINHLKNKIDTLNQDIGVLNLRIESLESSKRKNTLMFSLIAINILIIILLIQLQWKIIPGFLN